jgi:hypothetical protein
MESACFEFASPIAKKDSQNPPLIASKVTPKRERNDGGVVRRLVVDGYF